MEEIIKNLQAGRVSYEVYYKHPVFVNRNKTTARDAAFYLVYQILVGDFENEYRDSVQESKKYLDEYAEAYLDTFRGEEEARELEIVQLESLCEEAY